MGLVTVLLPLMTTGAGETALQTAVGAKLVAVCNVNPAALVGHVKITSLPERVMASKVGGGTTEIIISPLGESSGLATPEI